MNEHNCSGHPHEHNCLEELSEDHKKILASLDELEKAVDASSLDLGKVRAFLDFTKNFAEPHHHKEEEVLFPKLEEKGMPRDGGPIGMMLIEHEEKRAHIREITGGVESGDAEKIKTHARAVVSLMREHIYKEDNILYPCARDFLSDEELSALGDKCKRLHC